MNTVLLLLVSFTNAAMAPVMVDAPGLTMAECKKAAAKGNSIRTDEVKANGQFFVCYKAVLPT